MVPTSKEALTRLLETVLEFDSDNIDMMGKADYNFFNVLKNTSYKTLATLREKDRLTTSLW